ncbi:MAG: hypothetical protein WC876_07570 [Candidatus Thermoplasmatota archaeon]|jgi:hypothetical protein
MPRDTSAKGTAIERLVIMILMAAGYTVHRCVKTVVRTPIGHRTIAQDIFGCIDLVCKKGDEPTLWIQVTSETAVTKKVEALAAVPWSTQHDRVEIWRWVGGRPTRRKNGTLRPARFFQLYRRNASFEFDELDRIFLL